MGFDQTTFAATPEQFHRSFAANDVNSDSDTDSDANGLDDAAGEGIKREDDKSDDLKKTLARREDKAVRSLRVVLALIITVVAVLASVGVYLYVKNIEHNEFENEFNSQGLKVISGFQGDSQRKLQALESLSNSLTAHTLESDEQWPFVTIPNSAQHFEPYLSLANAASILLMPIVGRRQRYEWETYSVAKQGWIEEDLAVRQQWKEERGVEAVNGNELPIEEQEISRYIKTHVGIDTTPNDWIVWWQYAPVIPNRFFVNFNRLALDGFPEEVAAVRNGKAVVSSTWAFEPGLDVQSTKDFNFNHQLLQEGGSGDYQPGEPIGYIHYPVFDKHREEEHETAAVLTATVWWRTYFQDILPDTVKGIVCVIENSQGQMYTYRVDGPTATFLGPGDLHDSTYNDYVLSADYNSFADNEQNHDNTWYTGVPVDTEYISYTIHIYPSSEFEDTYMTDKPLVFTLVVAAVFVFSASIFVVYDCLVERRQEIVMTRAVKTNAVVNQIFPSAVRDDIMDHAVEQTKGDNEDNLKSFLADTHKKSADRKSNPIANFYPEATIMFSDIAGFTEWSSKREPVQVFTLLETVFAAFDGIARKRRVFKVETIGDCYVAVTGLPESRKTHALVMARFARECLDKFNQLIAELELDLGPGTSELSMRFGLHSGGVTAGVIRSDNARFQLFGDTVNTASRMESTGVRGKIQCSQQTADFITAGGKSHWLETRADKVFAKGKGELTTYFVNPKHHGGFLSSDGGFSEAPSSWDTPPTALSSSGRLEDLGIATALEQIEEHVPCEEDPVEDKVAGDGHGDETDFSMGNDEVLEKNLMTRLERSRKPGSF